jgi:hypothetical protein
VAASEDSAAEAEAEAVEVRVAEVAEVASAVGEALAVAVPVEGKRRLEECSCSSRSWLSTF